MLKVIWRIGERIVAAIDNLTTAVTSLGASVDHLIAVIPDSSSQDAAIQAQADAVTATQVKVDAEIAKLSPTP